MNPEKQALLEQLTAEQHNGVWWVTPTAPEVSDDELTQARRRRRLAEDVDTQTRESNA